MARMIKASPKPQAFAARRPVRKPSAKRAVDNSPPAETGLVDQVRALAGRLLDISSATVLAEGALKTAGKASRALRDGHPFDAAGVLVQAVLPGVVEPTTWSKTGAAIRTLREGAGLTIAEVGAAINLDDPSLIEALENGRIALSFELILRLAAVLGRNDPVGFVIRFTRSSNPEVWKSLEALGVGKLLLQSAREREFVNICRSNDEARNLSDKEFAEILGFTQAAFEMAMALRNRHRTRRRKAPTTDG